MLSLEVGSPRALQGLQKSRPLEYFFLLTLTHGFASFLWLHGHKIAAHVFSLSKKKEQHLKQERKTHPQTPSRLIIMSQWPEMKPGKARCLVRDMPIWKKIRIWLVREKGSMAAEHRAVWPAFLPLILTHCSWFPHTNHIWPFPNYWSGELQHLVPNTNVSAVASGLHWGVASWVFLLLQLERILPRPLYFLIHPINQ